MKTMRTLPNALNKKIIKKKLEFVKQNKKNIFKYKVISLCTQLLKLMFSFVSLNDTSKMKLCRMSDMSISTVIKKKESKSSLQLRDDIEQRIYSTAIGIISLVEFVHCGYEKRFIV